MASSLRVSAQGLAFRAAGSPAVEMCGGSAPVERQVASSGPVEASSAPGMLLLECTFSFCPPNAHVWLCFLGSPSRHPQ